MEKSHCDAPKQPVLAIEGDRDKSDVSIDVGSGSGQQYVFDHLGPVVGTYLSSATKM
jgi:hypothetical protein